MITRLASSAVTQGLPKYRSMLAGIPLPGYESIASVVVSGSTTKNISFTSIPSTYQHLQIRVLYYPDSGSSGSGGSYWFNDDKNNTYGYSFHTLSGDGTSTTASGTSNRAALQITWAGSAVSTFPTVSIIDIHDYASTTKNKTVRQFGGIDKNGSGGGVDLLSATWLTTTAINKITIGADTGGFGNLGNGATFALYGIKGA